MAVNQPTIIQHSRWALLFWIALFVVLIAAQITLSRLYGAQLPLLPLAPYIVLFAYLIAARRLLAGHHRKGLRAFRLGHIEDAIEHMKASAAFFQRHAWIDRLRFLTLLSTSAMSYREMALANTAFFLSQLGRGNEAKAAYGRLVEEFPENLVGRQALKMIETFESSDPP